MAIENITRFIEYRDTKSNIESLTGTLEEAAISYATDTGQLGLYTNGLWKWYSQTGSAANTSPSYPAVYDHGVFLATGTHISIDGNLIATISGSFLSISAPITTYFRVGQPSPLEGLTGLCWQVPDRVFASGSLAVFVDGLIKTPGVDYEEQFFVSGTYRFYLAQQTGTIHVVNYGVPCRTQIQPASGTVTSPFAIMDSDSILLLDSDSIQILDSDG